MRLGIVVSHPIQYYAPLFRELAKRMDVHVFYGQKASAEHQVASGFGVGFQWDVDLTSGYAWSVLKNRSPVPSVDTFGGCDVPSIHLELQEKRIDVLLVAGWYQRVLLQATIAAKRLGLPVLVRGDSQLKMPGSTLKRAAKRMAYPVLLRTFDAALYVGQNSRSYYERFKYPKQRLFFSPHCVDTDWFAARSGYSVRAERRASMGVSPEKKLVLFAGKLVDFKRPLDVIRGTACLRADGLPAEVIIAGAGPLMEQVAAEAQALAVPLHPLGFCNQSVMPSIYAAADVLALPSNGRETWGLVCNEALACNTPVVVSDQVGCAPDLAGDNWVGRQFPCGSDFALASALGRTLLYPPSAQKISQLSAQYSVGRAADGVHAAIDQVTRIKNPNSKSTRIAGRS